MSAKTSQPKSRPRARAAGESRGTSAAGRPSKLVRTNGSAQPSSSKTPPVSPLRKLLDLGGIATWSARLHDLSHVVLEPQIPPGLQGCSVADFGTKSRWLDGIHSIDLRRVEAFFKSLATTPLPAKIEYRLVRPAGAPVWVRHWVTEITSDGFVHGGIVDVQELKSAHAENLDVSEREQNRIGQDLHDDLCQVLAGLSCLTRVVERQLTSRAPDEAKALNEINQQLVDAMDRTRALTHGLFPARLKNGDVRGALIELSHQVKTRFAIETHLEFRGAFPQHDHLRIIQVYRLAQEAVSNSVKHGRAKNVHIDLRRQGDRMTLTIHDDGSGFPESNHNKEGIGLHIMRHRAALLGGELAIGNHPTGGARVALTYSTPTAHEKS